MSSFVSGIDVPISDMPAGMAFDGGGSGGGGFGSGLLGSIGKGLLGGLEKGLTGGLGGSGASSDGASRGSYSDQTRSMLNYLIAEAIKSFEPGQSTLS